LYAFQAFGVAVKIFFFFLADLGIINKWLGGHKVSSPLLSPVFSLKDYLHCLYVLLLLLCDRGSFASTKHRTMDFQQPHFTLTAMGRDKL
jgi:hypothetical protein